MNDVTRANLAEAAISLKKKLDKKNLLLARAEEKVLILEARQEEVGHMLMALREEKVTLPRIRLSCYVNVIYCDTKYQV